MRKGNKKDKFTLEDLPKGWEGLIFSMMGEGNSIESVLVAFDISRKIHARLCTEHDGYKEAFEKGVLMREAYIHEQVLIAATDIKSFKGNTTSMMFVAKNILGWRSEPFHKEREDVLKNKTGEAEIKEKFRKKENGDEKFTIDSPTVN